MAYATADDFITAYSITEAITLSNIDRPAATTVNTVVLDRALADATHKINSYVGIYRNLVNPPDFFTAQLRRCCCAYARLFLSIHGNDEVVANTCDDCDRWLKDVRDGKLNLGLDASDLSKQSGGSTYIADKDPIFDEPLRGY